MLMSLDTLIGYNNETRKILFIADVKSHYYKYSVSDWNHQILYYTIITLLIVCWQLPSIDNKYKDRIRALSRKKLRINETMRKLYWLVGIHSELDFAKKRRLLYVAIIKPIWAYSVQLWGCASKSNIGDIQRCQNIAHRTIVPVW